MNKKILALVLALALTVVCFAGCNNKTDDQTPNTPDVQSDGELPVLTIGGIGPLTGQVAVYGTAVRNGIQIAADLLNETAEERGYKIAVNFQDDEGDAEKAVNAYNLIKDNGAKLLIGTVTTAPCLAVNEYSVLDNMFQITPSGSALDCTRYDNGFRVCFTDPGQGVAAAQYIASNGLASSVAVIYDSSDAYSSGIYQAFIEEAAAQNLSVVVEEAFTADSKTDFSVQLQKVQESGAELLFLPIYYQEGALILQQASQMGVEIPVFGADGFDGILDQLGADNAALAENVMLMTPFVATKEDAQTQNFVNTYAELYNGDVPNQFAADGYDAVLAIAKCFDSNVEMVNASASDICEFLKEQMTQISIEGLTGNITWTSDGEPTKEPIVVRIVNGAYEVM